MHLYNLCELISAYVTAKKHITLGYSPGPCLYLLHFRFFKKEFQTHSLLWRLWGGVWTGMHRLCHQKFLEIWRATL